jgi:hypothetical protein
MNKSIIKNLISKALTQVAVNTDTVDSIATHAELKIGVHGKGAGPGADLHIQGDPDVESTGAVTVHIADMLSGIVVGNPSDARAYTLDTGANCELGLTILDNEAFEWSLINIATNAAFMITLTASSGHTIVGSPIVPANSTSTGGLWSSSAIFRTRKTTTDTFVTYRIC